MSITVDPADDLLHPLGPEPDFMETNYYNFFDQASGAGGFIRLGNRANEGWAEMTVCLYLPGGRVAFMFGRPPITSNDAFDAGGVRFEIVDPFRRQELRYDGKVALLEDPKVMADPKVAFASSPHVECHAELIVTGACAPWQPDELQGMAGDGTGHNEQLTAVAGTVSVGDEHFRIDGHGIRDHTWGARTWSKVCRVGRWYTGPLAADFAFMGFYLGEEDADPIDRGFVWDGDTMHVCDGFEILRTDYVEEYYQRRIEARLTSGDRQWSVHGDVGALIPLRHRKDGWVTRICEGLTRWTVTGSGIDGERSGIGLSEYMDQMLDGRPSGAA